MQVDTVNFVAYNCSLQPKGLTKYVQKDKKAAARSWHCFYFVLIYKCDSYKFVFI